MFTITDTITGQTITCAADDIAASIAPWYPEAHADVTAAITALQDTLTGDRYPETSELEALLSITWTRA